MNTIDKFIVFLESDKFKKYCLVFLAFAAGYFFHAVVRAIGFMQ